MKTFSLVVLPLVAFILAGCASQEQPAQPMHRKVVKTPGESNVYEVTNDDAEMARATQRARKTVPQFVEALQHPAPDEHGFAVKKLFVKNDKVEHIWLTDIHFVGNRFVGLVDNRPMRIAGLKLGDKVSVNPDEVSDWLFIRNGKLVGGYTLRVLMSEMTPAEREEFLKRAGFQMEP